jgi:hypothetical protein
VQTNSHGLNIFAYNNTKLKIRGQSYKKKGTKRVRFSLSPAFNRIQDRKIRRPNLRIPPKRPCAQEVSKTKKRQSQDKRRQEKTRQDKTRQDKTRQDKTRQGQEKTRDKAETEQRQGDKAERDKRITNQQGKSQDAVEKR